MTAAIRHWVMALAMQWLIAAPALHAQIKPAAIFTDDMVVQRDRPMSIWGTANPGDPVAVQFAQGSSQASADAHGRWIVRLPAPSLSNEPQDLRISGPGTSLVLHNILVGDVWLCAGQSNMAFALRDATGGEADMEAAASLKSIRWIAVPNRAAIEPREAFDIKGERIRWRLASARSVGDLSAVAFYFARHVHARIGVPIGVVTAAWGGTPIEAWIPNDRLSSLPNAQAIEAARLKILELMRDKPTAFPYGPDILLQTAGATCYNGMVHPTAPLSVRGVLWYQGEQNAGSGHDRYTVAMQALIESWRAQFDHPELPFLYVQLPNFADRHEGSWPMTREAQLWALHVPNTAMAVTIDQGDAQNIHPLQKGEVGRRLALLALNRVYGQYDVPTGPIYQTMSIEGASIRVSFTQVGTGLVCTDAPTAEPREFEIAGMDRRFVPAKARIDGVSIVVSAEGVSQPVAVRYAWRNAPVVNLYNKEGLPASPFRTDNWPTSLRSNWTVPSDWER